MIYLKMFFFDSSAILSWLLKQDGAETIELIYNRRMGNPICSLNISETVKREINKKLSTYHKEGSPRYNYFQHILQPFWVTGEEIKLDEGTLMKNKAHLIQRHIDLTKNKNSQDLDILNELASYMEFYRGPSRTTVVSCDNLMNKIAELEGFRVFNPRKLGFKDFERMILE